MSFTLTYSDSSRVFITFDPSHGTDASQKMQLTLSALNEGVAIVAGIDLYHKNLTVEDHDGIALFRTPESALPALTANPTDKETEE